MEDVVKNTIKDAIKVLPEYTPYYIMDEVQYYFDKTNTGKNDCFTLENVICLVNMAKFSNRVNDKQTEEIKKSIRKIKEKYTLIGRFL